jgi:hypothetical protein
MRSPAICLLFFCSFLLTGEIHAQQQYQLSRKDTSDVRFLNSRKFWIYKVEKGQTIFSISQKFKIPQEEIHEFNPDISKSGLKAKMKLWIPAYSWLNKNKERVDDETVNGRKSEDQKKQKLKILVLSGLELQKNYSNTGQEDSTFIKELIDTRIRENLEFWEGVLIAAKAYAGKESKAELIIQDTQSDSMQTRKFLAKYNPSSIDLIITNENGPVLHTISGFSKRHSITLISSGVNSTESILDNEKAYALSPSSLWQCRLMGKAAANHFKNANLILLKTGISKEDERLTAFREGWNDVSRWSPVRKVNFSKGYSGIVVDSMQKNKQNVLFLPSSNEDVISSTLSSLREHTGDYKISVIGLPTWLYSQNIDPVLFDTCNTYLFSAGNINSNSTDVIEFRKKFRDHYHTEPMESAFVGYDALNCGIAIHHAESRKRAMSKDKTIYKGLFNSYRFQSPPSGLCKENQLIHFYRFEKNLPENIDLEIPEGN